MRRTPCREAFESVELHNSSAIERAEYLAKHGLREEQTIVSNRGDSEKSHIKSNVNFIRRAH